MADFQNFAVTRQSAANVNVPTHRLEAQLTDSGTGAMLADFTGDNAVEWPSVLATLTTQQQDQIASDLAQQVLLWKAGL